eukprot:4943745-Amphidinium_carterae.1
MYKALLTCTVRVSEFSQIFACARCSHNCGYIFFCPRNYHGHLRQHCKYRKRPVWAADHTSRWNSYSKSLESASCVL